jgi:membrane-bound serine protease (ClpP class)
MTRRLVAALALVAGVLMAAFTSGGPASAAPVQDDPDPGNRAEPAVGTVEVIEVSGLLDPILVDFVQRSIADAEASEAVALVLQLNSPGSVVDDERLTELARAMADASVPVTVWIGPSGAKATGGAAEIALLGVDVGMAPGTRIGNIGTPRLPDPEFGGRPDAVAERLADRTYDDEQAVDEGLVDRLAPTVGLFISDIDGFETEEVENEEGEVVREPVTGTRFSQLSLPSQLLHTAASPAVAYLLLVLGMGLVLFEFFTAGVGVAAVVAVMCLLPAGYGLGVLPVRGWALGLMVVSMFAFAVDVQTGVPRFWTGVGFALFMVGTFWLFDGVDLSWITLLVVFAGVPVAVLAGMPAMVRTRFSTPTIGREWMVGELGRAVGDVDPDGTVLIREALWRARVNRATPVVAGDPVRVIGLDGPVLEVEPEEGAARDYRER